MTLPGHKHESGEYIAFIVREQEFCVDIQSIREIRGWTTATRLPHVPDFVVGVINLRGTILPIVDVSKRFGMGACEPKAHNVIIVVQVGDQLAGMLVDSVSDILQIDDSTVQNLPDIDAPITRDFLKQVIIHDERIICEIALDALMPEAEVEFA